MRQQWADYRVFWREFRQSFHTTGAVLPSGPALAAALCRYVRDANGSAVGRRILEVGPGTGAVTHHLVRAMRPDDRLELVERNAEFVARLRDRLDADEACRPASDRITLREASVEDVAEDQKFDIIVSGLPLNNFSVELVEQILAKLSRLLAPGGTLSFFEYIAIRRAKSLVGARAERARLTAIGGLLHKLLDDHEIHRDRVLANVPPAWVHHVRLG